MKGRTIENLRNRFQGKIYVSLNDEKVCIDFYADAEKEGYRFGEKKPTESRTDDIIAIENGKRLSYVGFAGRMAYQSGGGRNFHRVDYAKYKAGDSDYMVKNVKPRINKIDVAGKFHTHVAILGKDKESAVDYLSENAGDVSDCGSEERLYMRAMKKFHVVIAYDS